ncbi:hypothetical protein C2845_PM11G03240 [Panicum miliaceum]|uniref:Uncharacterized protein n=1 Tax=Panicum miliaceum TaxID=4540 RepID=A0A3L6RSK6_PANMI|nr:hypothetical protein C2845_PM11G03240 [Panicum miliaceum]
MISPSELKGRGMDQHGLVLIHCHGRSNDSHCLASTFRLWAAAPTSSFTGPWVAVTKVTLSSPSIHKSNQHRPICALRPKIRVPPPSS